MAIIRGVLMLLAFGIWSASGAQTVRLTMYDDGLACPANCDSHVVFHPSMNGTEFAHLPAAPIAPFASCVVGEPCALCIESGGAQCLEAIYRGGGPPPMTFDFTPRFYEEACAATPRQTALAQKCTELRRAAVTLEGRINCIAEPTHTACAELMAAAISAYETDHLEYLSCVQLGEREFNATVPPERRRALSCAYEARATGGPNSRGQTWRRLLPGSCRAGTFVGRDGLDCCSGSLLADGPLGRECRSYYLAGQD